MCQTLMKRGRSAPQVLKSSHAEHTVMAHHHCGGGWVEEVKKHLIAETVIVWWANLEPRAQMVVEKLSVCIVWEMSAYV
ncbi:hypothetical protein EYF80_046986 [Liparis tanakae]|uniref:Uncharacterized protein n=1 Tax=Liparis tanakae TaxID=230148 RepID=A0A4Z2FNK2_9TELE|nr:hypothetical protein EYF80_046986 [Liparis tanakae]